MEILSGYRNIFRFLQIICDGLNIYLGKFEKLHFHRWGAGWAPEASEFIKILFGKIIRNLRVFLMSITSELVYFFKLRHLFKLKT